MRSIKKNKYFLYFLIVIVAISFCMYLNSWLKAYKNEELKSSYISKYINELSYDEFNNYIKENPNFFAYIGKKNCKECIVFEKKLYKTISNKNLIDKFIFLNINNEVNKFNKGYLIDIESIPSIAIIKGNKIEKIIEMNNEKDIEEILDKEGIV